MTVQDTAGVAHELPPIVVKVGTAFSAIISSPWVAFILVPVLVTLGALYLKAAARPEDSPNPGDTVVGFDLGITACVTLLLSGFLLVNRPTPATPAAIAERQSYIIGLFIVLAFFAIALSLAARGMRKRGWERKAPPGPYTTIAPWPVFINLGGGVLLIIAFVLTGGTFR